MNATINFICDSHNCDNVVFCAVTELSQEPAASFFMVSERFSYDSFNLETHLDVGGT